jgi:hypothetical protein
MPWSVKAQQLLRKQHAPVGAAASAALPLGSALATARVGTFLEQHRSELMVEERWSST